MYYEQLQQTYTWLCIRQLLKTIFFFFCIKKIYVVFIIKCKPKMFDGKKTALSGVIFILLKFYIT